MSPIQAIANAYYESNARDNQQNQDKVYSFILYDQNLESVLKRGTCNKVTKYYDVCYDCNIVTYHDIEEDKFHSTRSFYITLKEIQ